MFFQLLLFGGFFFCAFGSEQKHSCGSSLNLFTGFSQGFFFKDSSTNAETAESEKKCRTRCKELQNVYYKSLLNDVDKATTIGYSGWACFGYNYDAKEKTCLLFSGKKKNRQAESSTKDTVNGCVMAGTVNDARCRKLSSSVESQVGGFTSSFVRGMVQSPGRNKRARRRRPTPEDPNKQMYCENAGCKWEGKECKYFTSPATKKIESQIAAMDGRVSVTKELTSHFFDINAWFFLCALLTIGLMFSVCGKKKEGSTYRQLLDTDTV